MSDSGEKFRPLKDFVARRGGLRLSLHGRLRDQIVEAIVEEWPESCEPSQVEQVVKARMKVRLRKQYSSVIGVLLLSALVNIIVKLVVEWWLDRNSHRVLMHGWRAGA